MSKSPKRDFHESVYNNINIFITTVEELSKQKDLQDAYDNVPDIVTRGRSFFQIICDDVLDAYASIMQDLPDEDIPLSYPRQILAAREGRAISTTEGKKHLDKLLAEKRALPDGEDVGTPEFISMFSEAVPKPIMENIWNRWFMLTRQFGNLLFTDSAILSNKKAQKIINAAATEYMQSTARVATRQGILETMSGSSKGESAATNDDEDDDKELTALDTLYKRIKESGMPAEAMKRAKGEFSRLESMNPQTSEYSIITKYLDVLASLPWNKSTPLITDVAKAQQVLDDDHYGMTRVKDAIIEQLAVMNRVGTSNGQIMCVVGPPGVGKTSLASSISKATGRVYARLALGGVTDEAAIRGHRRTYIGALPGKVMQSLIDAGTNNPLFALDEIDKLGVSRQGDPGSALLELLDPEQNHAFTDHYVDIPFDCSKIMLFCTANEFSKIDGPLRDRMEVIHLPGYLHDEKFQIAKRYLIPKQTKLTSLKKGEITIEDSAINRLIDEYTMEAGVRGLERMIKKVCRKVVSQIDKKVTDSVVVTADNLPDYAGVSKVKHDLVHAEDEVGVVNGLAYTSVGGCRLPIQAVTIPAKGFGITATGMLGDVMKESVKVAERFVRSHAEKYGISQTYLNSVEIGLHAPDGAVPKDGPSAGLAMATVIISALTGTKIRHDLAMTGEIDLKGNAGKIGGLPEKLEGALRAGVKTVIIPRDNVGDLADVPDSIKSKLTIIPVDTIDDVLQYALSKTVQPLPVVQAPRTLTTIFDEIRALTEEANALMARQAENDNSHLPPAKVANGAAWPFPTAP